MRHSKPVDVTVQTMVIASQVKTGVKVDDTLPMTGILLFQEH